MPGICHDVLKDLFPVDEVPRIEIEQNWKFLNSVVAESITFQSFIYYFKNYINIALYSFSFLLGNNLLDGLCN